MAEETIKVAFESDTRKLVKGNERAVKSEKELAEAAADAQVKITKSNQGAAASTEVLTSAQKRQVRAFERLVGELDESQRETQQLTKAHRILGQALRGGRIQQQEYTDFLQKAERRYSIQQRQLQELRRELDRLEDELDDTAREANQYTAVQERLNAALEAGVIDQGRYNRLLDQAEKKYSRSKSGVGSLTSRLEGLTKAADIASAGALALGLAFEAVDRTIGPIARAGDLEEKLTSQLRVALGSQEAALDTIARIRALAAPTPLSVVELTTAWVKLQNFGLAPTEKRLLEIGDLASAMNKSLDDAVEALLDASQGESERLKAFGVRMKTEGDRVTITFKGVSRTVEKESGAIVDAILDISRQNFAGSLASQATTLSGKLSTLRDSWDLLMAAIFRSGVGDALKGAVDAATGLVAQLERLFTSEERLQSLIREFTPEWKKNSEQIQLNAGARESLAKANQRLAAGEELLGLIRKGAELFDAKLEAEDYLANFVRGSVRYEEAAEALDALNLAFEENQRRAAEAKEEMNRQAKAAQGSSAAAKGAAGTNADLAKSIKKVIADLERQVEKQRRLNEAFREGEGDLTLLEKQLAALAQVGLPFDSAGPQAEKIRALVEQLHRLNQELEQLQGIEVVDLPAPRGDLTAGDPTADSFRRSPLLGRDPDQEEEQEKAKKAAEEAEAALRRQQDAYLDLGAAAASALSGINEGWADTVRGLADVAGGVVGLIRLFKDLERQADGSLTATSRLQSAVAGARFGATIAPYLGGGPEFGSYGQTLGGDYTDSGAQLGGFVGGFFGPGGGAIGSGLGGFLGSFFDRFADEARSEIFEAGERAMQAITTDEGGLGDVVRQVGEGIISTVRDLERQLGTELDLDGFQVNIEGDLFEVVAGGVQGYFGTVEQAVAFGVRQALGSGELDPEIRQALDGFTGSLSELQEDLAVAFEIRDLAIGAERAEFRQVFAGLSRLTSEIGRLGIATDEAYAGITRSIQESRDSALGIERSLEEIRNARVAAWNAERTLLEANLRAQLLDHEARRAELALRLAGTEAAAAETSSRRAALLAQLQAQDLTLQGAAAVQNAVGASAAALAVIDQQIAALRGVLANLPAAITPEELANRPLGGGFGGGRQRREQREAFQFQLESLRLTAGGASDLAISLRERARELRQEADALRRLGIAEDLIQEWLELQQQIERADVLEGIRDQLRELGGSEVSRRIEAITSAYAAQREQLELLGATDRELAEATALYRAELEALAEAQAAQRQVYADLADGVSPWQRQMLDLQEQFAQWEQDTRDLVAATDGSGASVAALAAALGELEAQQEAATNALFGDLLRSLDQAGVEIPGFAEQMIGLEFAMLRANVAAAALEDGFADYLSRTGTTLDELLANIDAAEQRARDALTGPDDNGPATGPSFDHRTETAAQAAARELESALDQLRDALDQLRGNNPAATPGQSFQLLQSRYLEALAAAQGGDAEATRETARLALQLQEAGARYEGTAGGFFRDLFGDLEGDLEGLLAQGPILSPLEQIGTDQLATLQSIDTTLSAMAGGAAPFGPRLPGAPAASAGLTATEFAASVGSQVLVMPPVPLVIAPSAQASATALDLRELVRLEKDAARARKSAQQQEGDEMRENNRLLRQLLASQAETRERILRLEANQPHGGRR